ncbi:hypothetical protein DUNSADRAFT_10761 [Dunaliella salina]|uniref:Elongator complex protein 5 n=1 Tax=Dunaliella salina TaxID=3046 RepID=A0ABQ7GEM2_DUNSA|nr:hypothetical protein DUNSADRAFT_10761 [Dunaliella salina]|eukprot:KAF5833055.1 hypothetical protein DUNSADRAFT_10761 [Dunaliella salina]
MHTQEREARDAVVLPYEHQGQHGQYRTSDWRDYLPPSAGGRNPANAQHARHLAPARPSVPHPAAPANDNATAQPDSMNGPETSAQQQQAGKGQAVGEALGRILYVRDSDDGAASDGGLLDSDEDPDDDLDI